MRRGVAVLVAAGLVAPATAGAESTPEGSATLVNVWRGAATLERRGPEVLTAWRVTVEAGGRAGPVRLRARSPLDARGTLLGDPVELPAAPGTYTYPAPHLRWDYRSGVLGLDQTVGGHAIVDRQQCRPELGDLADPCATQALQIFRGDPPPGERPAPDEEVAGARLRIEGIFEPDIDEDFAGDRTEDRTDLALSALRRGRTVHVTVANNGPRAADRPVLQGAATWGAGCLPHGDGACHLDAPLAPGARRTVTFDAGPDASTVQLVIASEGPDLRPEDNTEGVRIPAAPAYAATAAARQRLARGIAVEVASRRSGRARVVAAFRTRGRSLFVARTIALRAGATRRVVLRPTGAVLRSLRRALRRGPVSARISVAGTAGPRVTVVGA